MSSIFLSIIFISFFFSLFSRLYFISSNRINSVLSYILKTSFSAFPSIFKLIVFFFAYRQVFYIISANMPIYLVPNIHYSYVLFMSFVLWFPIIIYSLTTNFTSFFSHLVPFGTPTRLMFLLPLVEIFSQIIRPLTLTIRFATNLSAGHIMMFIFSYFSLLSPVLYPFIHIVLLVLLLIEVFIAFLQSYIFITLLSLYLLETI
jgi:F-type H+-transporting ATPase subunit a